MSFSTLFILWYWYYNKSWLNVVEFIKDCNFCFLYYFEMFLTWPYQFKGYINREEECGYKSQKSEGNARNISDIVFDPSLRFLIHICLNKKFSNFLECQTYITQMLEFLLSALISCIYMLSILYFLFHSLSPSSYFLPPSDLPVPFEWSCIVYLFTTSATYLVWWIWIVWNMTLQIRLTYQFWKVHFLLTVGGGFIYKLLGFPHPSCPLPSDKMYDLKKTEL